MSRLLHTALLILLVFSGPTCALRNCAAQDDDEGPKSDVQLTIIGTLNVTGDTATITAEGSDNNLDITFNLGFDKPVYWHRARLAAGRNVEVRGALLPRPLEDGETEEDRRKRDENQAGHENYILVVTSIPRLKSPTTRHCVRARAEVVADTDRVAIGSETTGIEIEIAAEGERRWELKMSAEDREKLLNAETRFIEVHGLVTLQRGNLIPFRWILTVSELVLRKS